MKKAVSIIAPLLIAIYEFAWISEHAHIGVYKEATAALILVGCIAWFAWGLVTLD